uniref:Uncharacterized protein n=1 Tax=Cucumis melo TaxID=3656 RepID=A0A9I9E2B6_CUCME
QVKSVKNNFNYLTSKKYQRFQSISSSLFCLLERPPQVHHKFVCHQFSPSPQDITRFHFLFRFQSTISSSACSQSNCSSCCGLLAMSTTSLINLLGKCSSCRTTTSYVPQTTTSYASHIRPSSTFFGRASEMTTSCTRRTFLDHTSHKLPDVPQSRITETPQGGYYQGLPMMAPPQYAAPSPK